jgi:hypothetical protein
LDTPLSHSRSTAKLQALIADLRWRVQLLDTEIYEEEKRTRIFDTSNVAYSILARNLRARRDNLFVTIRLLEKQLVETDVAA